MFLVSLFALRTLSVSPPPPRLALKNGQRKDEDVTEVVGHSSHVSVYSLERAKQTWVR